MRCILLFQIYQSSPNINIQLSTVYELPPLHKNHLLRLPSKNSIKRKVNQIPLEIVYIWIQTTFEISIYTYI